MGLFSRNLPDKDNKGNPINPEYVDGYNNPHSENPHKEGTEEHDNHEAGQDAGHNAQIDPDEPYYKR
jgi:hypothetical protein